MRDPASILVLGIGNVLLSDDGVGVHVIRALEALQREGGATPGLTLQDGGTIGLTLLNDVGASDALIAVDAMQMGDEPGTVRSFHDADMDRQLGGSKKSAHEVALADLMAAAHLSGSLPPRRALVGIQPQSTGWGLAPTDAVAAAVPEACRSILSIIEGWRHG